MAGLKGYPLMVKTLQNEAIRIYQSGDKDFALLRALAKRKLMVVEKFTDMDRELLRNYQLLLYYKSRVPDILLAFSMEQDKLQKVYEVINTINSVMNQVEQAVQSLRESDVMQEFFKREREKREQAIKARQNQAQTQSQSTEQSVNDDSKKEEDQPETKESDSEGKDSEVKQEQPSSESKELEVEI